MPICDKTLDYPIPYHRTWNIIDGSKLSTYMTCPRMFQFEYLLGWRPDRPNNHLVFGTAWHLAMEHLLLNDYSDQSVYEAYQLFEHEYRKEFPPSTDNLFEPKSPFRAFEALTNYVHHWRNDRFDVLATEIGGSVSLGHNLELFFRMDSVLRTPDGYIFSLEHKTGSRRGRVWNDQWPLSMQVGTYSHVLHSYYASQGPIQGITMNGTFFSKKTTSFERVPCNLSYKALTNWWTNALMWLKSLQKDFELFSKKPSDAFWQNTTNCTKYFGCPYFDFCLLGKTPADLSNEHPQTYGMKTDFWDPLAEEPKETIHITK